MTDGFALIEINTKGEARLKEENGLHWFDFRLEQVCFDDAEGTEQLAYQLPNNLKDALVLVTFDYVCNCSRGWEGDYDCEELFNVVSHTVVKENYKEFYREMITEDLNVGIGGIENLDSIPENFWKDKRYYQDLIASWEEFYDEDFVPFKKETKKFNGVIDLMSLLSD